MIEPKHVLIYLAHLYQGDWRQMYDHIISKKTINSKEVGKVLENLKSKVLTFYDDEYPDILRKTYCPPLVLFYHGDVSLLTDYRYRLSVIGSRKCNEFGEKVTKEIVGKLPENVCIISGLAVGIDAIAHKTAMSTDKKTIAILGCGINLCYTKSNADIYEEIKKYHLVISEYPDVVEPQPDNFPFRNRIIAALGDGLLVTQAKIPSGSLTTVNYALNLGKEIMCVPHSPFEDSNCNQLIKEGAHLVESSSDVMDILEEKISKIVK